MTHGYMVAGMSIQGILCNTAVHYKIRTVYAIQGIQINIATLRLQKYI